MIPRGISLDSLSLSTHYLRMFFSQTDTVLSTGTGFLYELEGEIFMITNGHNITGINPETKTRISNHSGIPDIIKTKTKALTQSGELYFHPDLFFFDLYRNKNFETPLWYIHPNYGYDVDVVAIPVIRVSDVPEHIKFFPINKFNLEDIYVQVADDVFVLGYPYDINGGKELPIWKKGSIATEPFINIDNLPKIFIDTATRPGMSGSPVIYRRSGLIKKNPSPNICADDIIGTVDGFLGVYSGRIHSNDKFEAQLGIVWKSEVIEEIIKGKVLGTIDFQKL